MQFEVKHKNGTTSRRTLTYVKNGASSYLVMVDGEKIGTVWKDWGQVKKYQRHFLIGTEMVDRWFSKTNDGVSLGDKSPLDEGFRTRLDATAALVEAAFKYKRDWSL